jgi:hypothetical protein
MERRFIGFYVDGGKGGERGWREIVLGEGLLDKPDDLIGADAALGADAGDERARMIEQLALAAGRVLVDTHLDGSGEAQGIAGLGDPGGMAFEHELAADEQRHHGGLGGRWIGEHPARRRIVEATGELGVGGGGEHGRTAELSRNFAGETVGAVMAAEEGHDLCAVLRDGDHRGFDLLVAETGREQADEDAGSADADNRATVGEEAGQQQLAVFAVEAAVMHLRADERSKAGGRIRAGGGKGDNSRLHPQASLPR